LKANVKFQSTQKSMETVGMEGMPKEECTQWRRALNKLGIPPITKLLKQQQSVNAQSQASDCVADQYWLVLQPGLRPLSYRIAATTQTQSHDSRNCSAVLGIAQKYTLHYHPGHYRWCPRAQSSLLIPHQSG
jgi:hypothetical protein